MFFDAFDSENGGVAEFNYRSFTQWNVTRGDVDLIGTPGAGDFYPGRGLYVDLDGSPGRGRLETKTLFELAPGAYRLSLAIGNNPFLGALVQTNHARVTLAGVYSEDFTRTGPTPLEPVARLFSLVSAASGRLVIESLDAADFAGVVIDDVRLELVPEPGALLLAAAAFGAPMWRAARRSFTGLPFPPQRKTQAGETQ